jgi:hypothetical protein
VISQYDYVSDELARRTDLTTSGAAFATPAPQQATPQAVAYTTNNLNQYPQITVGSAAPTTLRYDEDGNLTNDGVLTSTYDAENRLTTVTPVHPADGAQKVELAYDYLSRRTQKKAAIPHRNMRSVAVYTLTPLQGKNRSDAI